MPSLVGGRDMNSFDYDRGGPGRMNGMAVNGGFDNFRDDFGREDMRREEDERYRRGIRNGGPGFDRFNTDYLEQSSLSEFRSNEPKFELDHLATFAAGTRNGYLHAEDGLRKLRQMENTTGIWTMRCVLIVERNYLVILDYSTGEELERYPIHLVQDPTAILKNDHREIYNNLLLFTIVDDPKKRSMQADMHIFQSCKSRAQEIVDEILAAKSGQQRLYSGGSRIPPPPMAPAPEPPGSAYDFQGMREYIDSRHYNSDMRQVNQQRSLLTRISTLREKEDIDGGSTEILERDVQLLNHCFDDIEKFVARLQLAAESYKELEKRKRERGAKNKKKQSGDGMLIARARPPADTAFVDIFQKFKLSFNLLAKLKAHIHDPNAPELVHFLFTPLSLIYEASRDPSHGNQNLGDQAVSPVLTTEAKQLLLNCLTSKEIELWQALGKHWTTSRDEWNGHIPAYVPTFYDGWQPAASVIDELTARSAVMSQPPSIPPLPIAEPIRTQADVDYRPRGFSNSARPMPFPDDDRMVDRYRHNDDFDRFEATPRGLDSNHREFEPPLSQVFDPVYPPSRGAERGGLDPVSRERASPRPGPSNEFDVHHMDRNVRPEIPKPAEKDFHIPPAGPLSRQEENAAYFEELKRMGDTTIYEAAHDRTGKNAKELTVQKGDILQVLDGSKNWWKLRNYKGAVGFAPYTILKPVKTEGADKQDHSDHSDILNGAARGHAADTSFSSDKRLSQRGDSKYF